MYRTKRFSTQYERAVARLSWLKDPALEKLRAGWEENALLFEQNKMSQEMAVPLRIDSYSKMTIFRVFFAKTPSAAHHPSGMGGSV